MSEKVDLSNLNWKGWAILIVIAIVVIVKQYSPGSVDKNPSGNATKTTKSESVSLSGKVFKYSASSTIGGVLVFDDATSCNFFTSVNGSDKVVYGSYSLTGDQISFSWNGGGKGPQNGRLINSSGTSMKIDIGTAVYEEYN
jgi:hypothetical protein